MAIQAQFPSNIILPDFRNRIGEASTPENRNLISAAPFMVSGTLEELQLQPPGKLLQVCNSGLNVSHQSMLNGGGPSDLENDLAAGSRKRSREVEELAPRQRAFIPLLDLQQPQVNNAATAFLIPQTATAISTGLRLTLNDVRDNSSMAFATARSNSLSFLSILQEELQSEMMKQKEEMDQFINLQGERMKLALEEKRQRHTRCLLATIEQGVFKRLKEKEAELEKVNRKNLELEDRVKQLSLESHLWQTLAKNNEAMVSNLRTSLEQVVEAEDAESCYYGEEGDAQARTIKENKELKEQRNCRECRTNNVCILLLPCRHLCLCKGCDSKVDVCPVCRSRKNASVQVYMA